MKKRDYSTSYCADGAVYYETFVLALQHHPEYNYSLVIWKSTDGTFDYRAGNDLSAAQITGKIKQANAKANAIIPRIIRDGMTRKQKLRAIHNYLVKNCVYDENARRYGYDLPAMVNIIFGYMAGRCIGKTQDKLLASQQLMFWGAAGIMAGLAWDLAFPINKPLWTSSYVFFSCGWASVLLGMFIYVIDVSKKDKWTNPLLTFGMNPLFIFVMAGLVAKTLALIKVPYDGGMISMQPYLFKTIFIPLGGLVTDDLRFASLLFALFYIIVFWLLARILYIKKIFIKL